jgi:uncharacterized membrane protein
MKAYATKEECNKAISDIFGTRIELTYCISVFFHTSYYPSLETGWYMCVQSSGIVKLFMGLDKQAGE